MHADRVSNLSRASRPLSLAKGSLAPLAIIAAAILLQLLVRPWMVALPGGEFYAKLLLDIGVNVVLAVSLTIVNGFTGQFSIGHAAFMAVGGYTAAVLVYYGSALAFGGNDFASTSAHAGVLSTMLTERPSGLAWFTMGDGLFVLSLLAAAVTAAGCGYLVGLPSLRLRGDYLAIVTLGFGEIVRVLIQSQTRDVVDNHAEIAQTPVLGVGQLFHDVGHNWGTLISSGFDFAKTDWSAPLWLRSGASLGFSGLPAYTSLFWSWLLAGLTILVALRLKYSGQGRAMLAIRENEIAAEAMGVYTTRYKVRAFVIAAALAGMAGGMYAHTSGVTLNAGELGFQKSFEIIIMVVLGGLGSISGAAIAAGLITILPEILREPASVISFWGIAIFSVALLGVLVFARKKFRAALTILGFAVAWECVYRYAEWQQVDLSQYRMVFFALALVLMMILRPAGLLGLSELWDLLPAWITRLWKKDDNTASAEMSHISRRMNTPKENDTDPAESRTDPKGAPLS